MDRAIATVTSALLCGYLLRLTNGKQGIGWFLFSLFLIWAGS